MDDDQLYLNHYGLIANPFRGIPDRRSIRLGEKQLEILAHLKIGVEQTKGILLLLGEDGSGKSILLGCLLKIIEGDLLVATLSEPGISVRQFFAFLGDQFKIEPQIGSKAEFLIHFREFLLEAHSSGRKVLLVVEDAENQNDDVIEQIRLFSNMEDDGNKLMSILLVGTGKLDERLMEHRHRALQQRVAVRCQLDAFSEKEAAAYIRHRMMVAGCFLQIFSNDAVRAIHRYSGGTPKLIDLICDHALMRGFFEGVRTIDGKIIDAYVKAIRKAFDLGCSDLRAAAIESLNTNRSLPRKSRSSRWLAAGLALAAFLLIGLGLRFFKFEEKVETLAESAPSAPLRIYFETGSAKLSAEDFPSLNSIAEYLMQNPQAVAVVKGFTDSKGSTAQRMRIATARAEAAKDYLVRKKVDPARIQAFGIGAPPSPGAPPSTEEPKHSRRVEIEVDTGKNPIH